MTLNAVRWALRQEAGSVANKAVLVALAATKLDEHGRRAVPLADLVRETEASPATVKRALAALTDLKLIERVRQVDEHGADLASIYTLNPPKRGAHCGPRGEAHSEPRGGAQSEPRGEAHSEPGRGSPRASPQCINGDLLRKSPETAATASRARGKNRAAEVAKTARLAATEHVIAEWRSSHGEGAYPKQTYIDMTPHVDQLLRDDTAPEIVRAALALWDADPDARHGGLLRHLIPKVIKAARPKQPNQHRSTADERVAQVLALADHHADGTPVTNPNPWGSNAPTAPPDPWDSPRRFQGPPGPQPPNNIRQLPGAAS